MDRPGELFSGGGVVYGRSDVDPVTTVAAVAWRIPIDMARAVDISFVIPAKNEEVSLASVVETICGQAAPLGMSFEFVLVDDGSTDRTWEVITRLAKQDQRVCGLRFGRNFGKEAAVLGGLRKATGRAAIVLDADGQHPPQVIPELIAAWQERGYSIVSGLKRTAGRGLFRGLTAAGFYGAMRLITGMELRGSSDYKLLERGVIDALVAMPERTRFFRALTEWTGFPSTEIEFDVAGRVGGQSAWTLSSLLRFALHGVTAFSSRPLYLLFGIGLLGIAVSIVLAAQAIVSFATGVAVSGWASLTIVNLFFGSVNLVCFGVLGVYLARVFDEVKARPHYIAIDETPPVDDASDEMTSRGDLS